MAGVKRRKRDESGASAVEFALVFPVLALLLFGIISYGYMFTVRQAMTQAAAEGARAGAVAPNTADSAAVKTAVTSAVERSLSGFGMECTTTGVTCKEPVVGYCKGTSGPQCVTVEVSVMYDDKFDPFQIPLIPMPDTLSFSSTAEIN